MDMDSVTPRHETRVTEIAVRDLRLLSLGSGLAGALAAGIVATVLPRLLGWPPAVGWALGFFCLTLSMYAPTRVWTETKGSTFRGTRFFLTWSLVSIVAGLLAALSR